MNNVIYYKIKKIPNDTSFIKLLPKNVIEHSINKYGEDGCIKSLYAYYLLGEISGVNLNTLRFLENGKPIVDEMQISISHSKNYVAVCYSKCNSDISIDIECHSKNFNNTFKFAKLYKGFLNVSNDVFYDKWTEYECLLKVLNYKVYSKVLEDFKGTTFQLIDNNDKYSVSIYHTGILVEK